VTLLWNHLNQLPSHQCLIKTSTLVVIIITALQIHVEQVANPEVLTALQVTKAQLKVIHQFSVKLLINFNHKAI